MKRKMRRILKIDYNLKIFGCQFPLIFQFQSDYEDIEKMFVETQVPKLIECGFSKENITWKVIDIVPEKGCRYYAFPKMIAPCIVKS